MILITSSERGFVDALSGGVDLGLETVHASGLAEAGEKLAAARGEIDALVCGPDLPAAEVVGLADVLRRTDPKVAVVLVASDLGPALMRAALRAGVADVLPAGAPPAEISEAVDRALARSTRGPGSLGRSRGRVVTVFSSKGGSGKSFVASNLGVFSASRGTVALVDLDLDAGDLPIMLRLRPRATIVDAVAALDHAEDPAALRPHLTTWRDGIDLLAAPAEPGLADKVTGADVVRTLELLRGSHQTVIVDCPAAFTDQVLAAVDTTDELVLVASLDVPAIKAAKLALQTLRLLSFPDEKVRLLLNRADAKVGIRPSDAEKVLGRRFDAVVPSSRAVTISVNRGVPLAARDPGAASARPLAELAEAISVPRPSPAEPRRARGASA